MLKLSLLSGGIDSSLISALYIQKSQVKNKYFSVGYDEYKTIVNLILHKLQQTT